MYFTPMNILIRLPNWLGDMVMSTAFVQAVKDEYPGAVIDLIAKKGIDTLLDFFPPHHGRFVFSKSQYPGIKGAWAFGRSIKAQKRYRGIAGLSMGGFGTLIYSLKYPEIFIGKILPRIGLGNVFK